MFLSPDFCYSSYMEKKKLKTHTLNAYFSSSEFDTEVF